MLDKRNLKHREIDAKKLRIDKSFYSLRQFYLTDLEVRILKNKMPAQEERRRNILLRLDERFGFNRKKLAEILAIMGFRGYSRSHLYKILGIPVISSRKYKDVKEMLRQVGGEEILTLLVKKRALKKYSDSKLGGLKSPTF
jgi:hypothetical protein